MSTHTHSHKPSVQRVLVHLCDRFQKLRDLHCFCYKSMDVLLHEEKVNDDPETLHGACHFYCWLSELEKQFDDELNQLRENQEPLDLM